MKVTVETQPRVFIGRQPPETRRRLRGLLHDIERGHVQPEALDEELDGFYKVKLDNYRIILQCASDASGPFFRAIYAQRRSLVYDEFRIILGVQ